MPAIRSSSAQLLVLRLFSSSWSCSTCVSRSASACSRRVELPELAGRFLLLREDALLDLDDLGRAGPSSSSTSARSLTASSRASTWASRRIASAARFAVLDAARSRSCRGGATATPDDEPDGHEHAHGDPGRKADQDADQSQHARSYGRARRNGVSPEIGCAGRGAP